MLIPEWENLPEEIKNQKVYKYYNILRGKKNSLIVKRIFDIILSCLLIVALIPVLLILYIIVDLDTKGKAIFSQKRVTKYGKVFKIYKFRTMIPNAESVGGRITLKDDQRITKVGKVLRRYRLDELPQIFNILMGDLSFVGARPEVPTYVDKYTDEMMATLLLPAGVTSTASILFKDEAEILGKYKNSELAYVKMVMPQKMKYNLMYIEKFNIFYDLKIILLTLVSMIRQ